MVQEARLVETGSGLEPVEPGWFVVNAADAAWWRDRELGAYCRFESRAAPFAHFGINLHVLLPGEPNGMYHREEGQEDFLVLHGECLLIVEGRERPLGPWDFVHCPSDTAHIFVGAGEGPCVILMAGARGLPGLHYPVDETALRHRAGVERATDDEAEAYAPYAIGERGPPRAEGLPWYEARGRSER